YPAGLEWLPNIGRDDYRNYGLRGTLGRHDQTATVVSKMEDFGHLVTLMSMCYDRGSKIVGQIEQRLGEAPFLDFMRRLSGRYQFRILRVADLQRELEDYTGRSWKQFFDDWLYSKGMTDWCLEKVHIEQNSARPADAACVPGCARPQAAENSCRVTVLLR